MRMSNRRKRRSGNHAPDGAMAALDLALAQLFRGTCTECEMPYLDWFSGVDAVAVLGPETAEQMARAMFGSLATAQAQSAHWWSCRTCGNAGVFGGVEFD